MLLRILVTENGKGDGFNKDPQVSGEGLAIQADSGDPYALTQAVEKAAAKFGGIDIFVSNAGTLMFKPIEQFTLEDFNHIVVAVDLRAAYVGSKAALSHMGKGGRIVFVSSNIADHAAPLYWQSGFAWVHK